MTAYSNNNSRLPLRYLPQSSKSTKTFSSIEKNNNNSDLHHHQKSNNKLHQSYNSASFPIHA